MGKFQISYLFEGWVGGILCEVVKFYGVDCDK